jgi:alkyl hydroperoxide reductase subunit AhpC
VAQLRSHYPTIQAAGAEVLLVTFFPPSRALTWARRHKLPFPLASDESRQVYFDYGLGDATTMELLGPQNWLPGLKATLRTREAPSHTRHVAQLGGYFIVDDTGKLLYAHRSSNPSDHPDPRTLVRVLTDVSL